MIDESHFNEILRQFKKATKDFRNYEKSLKKFIKIDGCDSSELRKEIEIKVKDSELGAFYDIVSENLTPLNSVMFVKKKKYWHDNPIVQFAPILVPTIQADKIKIEA